MNKIFTVFVAFLLVTGACKNENNLDFHPKSAIVGLASPIQLTIDTTLVYVTDYFIEPSVIDSIKTEFYTCQLSSDKKMLKIFGEKTDAPLLSELQLYSKGFPYAILLKKNLKQKVTLSIGDKNFKTIAVKGEMNGWNTNAGQMQLKNGTWLIDFTLSPGKYQYLFVIDGKETPDPNNAVKESNGMGGFNSVLVVGKESIEPFITTKNFENSTVTIETSNDSLTWFVFWNNYRISAQAGAIGEVQINIPEAAAKHKRSHIRVFACNSYGIANDIMIPLDEGKPVTDAKDIKRTDKHAYIIYNMMIDRFNNGNKDNDRPLKIASVHPKADYYGGDIKGITEKIKDGYFKQLGINTIWMSPILKNPEGAYGKYPNPETAFSGYHGYWPISSTLIDNRMGTPEELKELIEVAHKNGINILLDYVANHVHQEHPVYKQHPDWATNLYLPDSTLNVMLWDEQRLTTWFDVFLPTLDFEKPEVVNAMTDSAVFWFANYNIDGFRHDATKHVPDAYWRALTYKLRSRIMEPQNRDIYQIGETYGSPELINSYVSSGLLDGQFDFNVYDAAVDAFAKPETGFKGLNFRINQSLKTYGYHNLMGYITGNQDRARFMSYADGSIRFDEDAKLAGWTRDIQVKDEIAYNRMEQLIALMMTIPGCPVIFYGDEIGMYGGNDPDNRKMMRFDNLKEKEAALKAETEKLVKLRKEHLSLVYGDFKTLLATDEVYVFSRNYFGETALVIFNKKKEAFTFDSKSLPSKIRLGNTLYEGDKQLKVEVPASSYKIMFFN